MTGATMKLKETVIKRPLTIGDTVYYVRYEDLGERYQGFFVTRSTVTDVAVNWGFSISYNSNGIYDWESIRESIFLTIDDAVNALKSLPDYKGQFTYDEC